MIKNLFNKLVKTTAGPGQSLVEVAIAAPLLIFMLIGVFEVGWALRGYLVLVNVNREITRFAVRPGYMDFSNHTKINESFDKVRDWVDTSLGEQLNLDFDTTDGDPANATLIISHLVVNTGLACSSEDTEDCPCEALTEDDLFEEDDFYIYPNPDNITETMRIYGLTSTSEGERSTRVEYEDEINNELKPWNNQLNCQILKKGGLASDNNIIITELFYDQPQLFGFPLISNPLTDPVPLYTRTSMRLIGASRGDLTQNINTIGPVCFAYPFTVHEDHLVGLTAGVSTLDILGGPGGGDWGFLTWNPERPERVFLEYELQFPQLSISQYHNTAVATDDKLSAGDWVRSSEGMDAEVVDDIKALVGQEIVIPVHGEMQRINNAFPPPSQVDAYRITRFIRVRIDAGIDTPTVTSNKEVLATYMGEETESCQ